MGVQFAFLTNSSNYLADLNISISTGDVWQSWIILIVEEGKLFSTNKPHQNYDVKESCENIDDKISLAFKSKNNVGILIKTTFSHLKSANS